MTKVIKTKCVEGTKILRSTIFRFEKSMISGVLALATLNTDTLTQRFLLGKTIRGYKIYHTILYLEFQGKAYNYNHKSEI